jgi:hypothetical protein
MALLVLNEVQFRAPEPMNKAEIADKTRESKETKVFEVEFGRVKEQSAMGWVKWDSSRKRNGSEAKS